MRITLPPGLCSAMSTKGNVIIFIHSAKSYPGIDGEAL